MKASQWDRDVVMAGGELFDVYSDQDFWGQAVGWPQRTVGGDADPCCKALQSALKDCP